MYAVYSTLNTLYYTTKSDTLFPGLLTNSFPEASLCVHRDTKKVIMEARVGACTRMNGGGGKGARERFQQTCLDFINLSLREPLDGTKSLPCGHLNALCISRE